MVYDVTQSPYNAVGDGATDDRAAIQSAIDDAETNGGGVVYFPQGTYLLDSTHPTVTGVALLIDNDNVLLQGFMKKLSILKLGEDLNISVVNFENCDNCGIEKLEIDGQRTLQTANSHGIRTGGSTNGLTIKDMFIHDVSSYGIGLQHGTLRDCLIDNVLIDSTGADGIDVKNMNDNNANNRMVNVTVKRAGRRSDLTGQASVDLRGPWNCTNIVILDFEDGATTCCQSGIRFRPGEANDTNGIGGHYSSLTNFYIEAGNTSTETVGVHINAYQVAVAGGVVLNTKTGVLVNQQECTISSVIAKGCNNGFMVEDSGEVSNGDRVMFSGCIARGNADSGFKIFTDECVLDGIAARGNTHGINLRTGSSKTVILGVSSSNSGNNLNVQSGGITYKAEELYT